MLPETYTWTFNKAFKGKEYFLGQKLDVTDKLLRKLKDANLIDEASFTKIKKLDDNASKVDELLDVVKRRDDSLLPKFCEILKDVDQLHVVERILPGEHSLRFELVPDALDTKLIITVEPRYGLPEDLYSKGVIDLGQRKIINDATSVDDRVFRLLKAVKQKCEHLKVDAFLQALEDHYQSHVVNLIKTNGKIGDDFGDVRPLNDQQRRRLWSTQDVVSKLDLQEGKFLDRLQARAVISDMQQKDVDIKSKQSYHESIQLLIEILERRSVANLKQFIECLDETKQSTIVQWLTEKGAVGFLHATIDQQETSERVELQAEEMLEKHLNNPNCLKTNDMVSQLRKVMDKNGYKIPWTKKSKSIAWYVMCHTVEKLESLRRLYESPSKLLTRLLQCIFSQVCMSSYSLQLSVKWTTEDFETCRRFLTETSGRPFELPNCHDEPPTEPVCIVSITVCESNLKI
jgi:hypothetical protein